jgi:hypothetical protein
VTHFLLQDLLIDGHVRSFLPLEEFARPGMPRDPSEYSLYMRETKAFIQKRNERMRTLNPEMLDTTGSSPARPQRPMTGVVARV